MQARHDDATGRRLLADGVGRADGVDFYARWLATDGGADLAAVSTMTLSALRAGSGSPCFSRLSAPSIREKSARS